VPTSLPMRAALVILGLASVAAYFVLCILLAGKGPPLGGDDLLYYYYPTYLATAEQLRRGTLPLWNPYQLCGVPWLAALQGGVLYPPHLLYLLLPVPIAMGTLAASHLALVAFGAFAFARRVGLAASAALLVAVVCVVSSRLSLMVTVPNALEAAAWLTPGCLGVLDAVEGRWRRALLWIGLAAGMSALAGFPQATAYSGYLWAGLLVGLLLARRAPLHRWAVGGAAAAGGIALGAALAAIELLPAVELARLGTRSLEPLATHVMLSMGYEPKFWSALDATLHPAGIAKAPLLSVGAVVLALLPCALLAARHRGLALVALALGVTGVLFAMGPATPLFEVYRALPLLSSFRFPSRILFTTDFCFALVAGTGLDAVVRAVARPAGPPVRPRRGRWRAQLPLWIACAIAVALAILLAFLGNPRSALAAGLVATVTLVAAVLQPPAAAVGGAVAALALLELLSSFPWGRLLYRDAKAMRAFHEELDLYRTASDPNGRVWVVSGGFSPRFPPRIPSVFHFRSVDDYEPANLRRQAEYFGYLMRGRPGLVPGLYPFSGALHLLGRGSDPAALEQRRRLLDLAGMRFILAPDNRIFSNAFVHFYGRAGLSTRGKESNARLLENPSALPRAFVTYRTLPAPPLAELMEELSRPDFDPLVRSYVEGSPGFEPAADAPLRGAAAAIVRDELHHVEIAATLAAPGLLVLADSYYPGWRAFADGEEIEIHPVNHLFRGVALGAGAHRVRFEYRPASVVLGAALSLTAFAAWLALAAWPLARAAIGRRASR
jgi:hypothetical protein